jgi:hypothetical protein
MVVSCAAKLPDSWKWTYRITTRSLVCRPALITNLIAQ